MSRLSKRQQALDLARIAMRNAFLLGQWPAFKPLDRGIIIALDGYRNG